MPSWATRPLKPRPQIMMLRMADGTPEWLGYFMEGDPRGIQMCVWANARKRQWFPRWWKPWGWIDVPGELLHKGEQVENVGEWVKGRVTAELP